MKRKIAFKTIVEEVVANGIGWVAGILSIDLLSNFFVAHRWWQVWHVFSKKTKITPTLFSFLEWTLTAIIGFVVMILINKLVRKKLFKKKLEKLKAEEIQSEENVLSTVYEESPSTIKEEEQTIPEKEKDNLITETEKLSDSETEETDDESEKI